MLRRPRNRPSRFRPWIKRRGRILRTALLPGIILAILGLWLFEPASFTQTRTETAAVENVAPRSLTVVDGDTVRLDGQPIRLIGYDTPETYRAECDSERQRGDAATSRLRELLHSASSAQLAYLPRRDQYGRSLARLTLDDRDVADVMVGEGLARRYDGGQRGDWC